jgi:putative ATPase
MATPLADRLRPQTLDEMYGQEHLIGKDRPIRRIIERKEIPNMVFYGPSGIGKTTLAGIIAKVADKKLHKLNATRASLADVKNVISEVGTLSAPNGILLYLDEIQYFNKKQQQALLEFVENGSITLIASTTENPYFYIYGALLSRSTVFEFKPLDVDDISKVIDRAIDFINREQNLDIKIEDNAKRIIAQGCGGDVRKAVNTIELCTITLADEKVITEDLAKELSAKGGNRYDRDGDSHYDLLSAYQKSMRGSDPDAAIYYLARILDGGDLISACRRLLVTACEDCSLSYPQIIPIVKACVDSAFQLGLPEARIPLANAVILVATSPKSNSAICAIDSAFEEISRSGALDIPATLRDSHYGGAAKLNHGKGYIYPHPYPNHYVEQQYLPDKIKNSKFYNPGENKTEQAAKAYWDKIKKKEK